MRVFVKWLFILLIIGFAYLIGATDKNKDEDQIWYTFNVKSIPEGYVTSIEPFGIEDTTSIQKNKFYRYNYYHVSIYDKNTYKIYRITVPKYVVYSLVVGSTIKHPEKPDPEVIPKGQGSKKNPLRRAEI